MPTAPLVRYVWWPIAVSSCHLTVQWRADWRCVSTVPGALCAVTRTLTLLMLELYAGNWEDTNLKVHVFGCAKTLFGRTHRIIPTTVAYTGARFDSAVEGTGPVFLEQLNCAESDSSLLDCHSFSAAEPTTCDHSQDVSIQCRGILYANQLLTNNIISYQK